MPRKRKSEEAKQASAISAISVDLGNAYSNLRADGGITADWRSIQGVVGSNSQMNTPGFDDVINYDGAWRAFGGNTEKYTSGFDDYPTTDRYTDPWYKRMFAYALHRAYGLRLREGPFYPRVVASIPAREFANPKQVEKIKDKLSGPYVITNIVNESLQVVIDRNSLSIIPEGAGAFYYMLDQGDKGGQSIYATGLWFVLDLGYLTADIVAFKDSEYIAERSQSDDKAGMRLVAQRVAQHVRGEGGPSLDPSDYDPELLCGTITRNARVYNIQAVRDAALASLGERVSRFLIREASGQNLSGVLLTGGGLDLMRNYIKAPGLPALIPVPEARRANVEGAYNLISE